MSPDTRAQAFRPRDEWTKRRRRTMRALLGNPRTVRKRALEVTIDGDRPQIDSVKQWREFARELNPELLPVIEMVAISCRGAGARVLITRTLGMGTIRNLGVIAMEVA